MIDINYDNVLNTIDNLNGEETSALLVKLQRNRQEFRQLDWDNKDRLKAAMATGTADEAFMRNWFDTDWEIQNHIEWIDGTIRKISFNLASKMAA